MQTGLHNLAVSSLVQCCVVMELLVGAARGAVSAEELGAAVYQHLEGHIRAHGGEWWVLKHHLAMHIPIMMKKFGLLLGCFVLERKHRFVKKFLQENRNRSGYEVSLIRAVTTQHIHDLHDWRHTSGLIDAKVSNSHMRDVVKKWRPHAAHVSTSMGFLRREGPKSGEGTM